MRHLRDKQLTLNGSKPGELRVMATGGGAYKFYDMIRDALGVDVLREDEMECLIIGKLLTMANWQFVPLANCGVSRAGFLHHRDPT
jgi:pantothenate kinase